MPGGIGGWNCCVLIPARAAAAGRRRRLKLRRAGRSGLGREEAAGSWSSAPEFAITCRLVRIEILLGRFRAVPSLSLDGDS